MTVESRAALMWPALVLLIAVGAAACGATTPDATAPDVMNAVCTAASADSMVVAREHFGRLHGSLHDLARRLQDVDQRAAAGRLLEAKQSVEAALSSDPPAPSLFRDLAALTVATESALAAVDEPAPDHTCDARSNR